MRGAFTITPRSRVGQARALARSYLDHHPDHTFDIVLVAERWPGGDDAWTEGPWHVVDFRHVPVPNPPTYHCRYQVDDLCVAIKPFAFTHLLRERGPEAMVYLDPEVLVLGPLDAAWRVLETHDIALVPRMRSPDPSDASRDRAHPDGGLYSPGFVGLRRGEAADEMLAWWCAREFTDPLVPAPCVAHPLDAVPVYFRDVGIVSDPASNVARCNLHDRRLTLEDGRFHADGRPVAWLHFTEHDRRDPGRVLPGQRPCAGDGLPAYQAISSSYADAVRRAAPRAPEADDLLRLANGVPVSRVLSRVVMQCIRRQVAFPSPAETDAFCDFTTRPDPALSGAWIAPVVGAVLDVRPDVAKVFPHAGTDKNDPDFNDWLIAHGAQEETLQQLLSRWGDNLRRDDGVTAVLALHATSPAFRKEFPHVLTDDGQHEAFAQELLAHAPQDPSVDVAAVAEYAAAQGGLQRVLDCYFSDPTSMSALPLLYDDSSIGALAARLSHRLPGYPRIDGHDLALFLRSAPRRRLELLLACLRYNPYVRDMIGGSPTVFRLERIDACLDRHGVDEPLRRDVANSLLGDWITPASQYLSFIATDEETARIFPERDPDRHALERMHYVLDRHGPGGHEQEWPRWARELLQWQDVPGTRDGINLCGPLLDATGVGESARALQRVIEAAGIECQSSILPSRFPGARNLFPPSRMYGAFDEQLPMNLVVANADASEHMRFWIPEHVRRGKVNVGYWVWETEALPERWKDSARGLDAILAPSHYAARAIARTVDVPVHTLPIALDLGQLGVAMPDRARFGLPEHALVFGFFFDTKSVLERKNPSAVIDAFEQAFGNRDDVCLVLKVNTPLPGNYEYERLGMKARGINVRWIERTLNIADTHALMASLDVYVSLHRSEGFGLTMAEAMAMGKPVIATGYSGNMDFMDADSALLVDHVVEASVRDHGPYPAGSRWATPSVAHCARLMQRLEDRAERSGIGARGQERVRRLLDPVALAERFQDCLRALCEPSRITHPGEASSAGSTVE